MELTEETDGTKMQTSEDSVRLKSVLLGNGESCHSLEDYFYTTHKTKSVQRGS